MALASALALAILATAPSEVVSTTASRSVLAQAQDVLPGWTDVSQPTKPPPMAGAMMEYSPLARRFLLFGGWDGAHGLNETWLFDPGNRTWNALHPPVSPIERGDQMLVYDDRADVFILFGGWYEFPNQTYIRLSDTWTFSLTTMKWTERHPLRSPSARSDPQTAYDPVADVTLLLGGYDGSGYLGDVWAYSLANDTWVRRSSPSQPSPRADGRMVYVPDQDRFILFGGNDYNGPNFTFHHLSDTWSYRWRDNAWKQLATPVAPSARDYPVLAVDRQDGFVLLTSGYGDRIPLNDVWGFCLSSDTWVNLTPSFSPPPRFAAMGGFDSTNNLLVLFGGAGNGGLLADTWYFVYAPVAAIPNGFNAILTIGLGATAFVAIATGFLLTKKPREKG
jgi:Galactose oxidase, central domain